VDEELVSEILSEHPYFALAPPKSTGREEFGEGFAAALRSRLDARGRSADDGLATATRLTARAVAGALERHLPARPDEVIPCGGGSRNRTLLSWIAELAPWLSLVPMERFGIPAEAKECVSFALLAAASIDGVPASLPSVTGATRPAILGRRTLDAPPPPRRPERGSSRGVRGREPRDRGHVATEQPNRRTETLDLLSIEEAFDRLNDEDRTVAGAVRDARDAICVAAVAAARAFERGGRLVYVGAGTSGRLGALDAAECGPTFRSPPGQVVGILAGGAPVFERSVEGAEDDRAAGERAIRERGIGSDDLVCGISAGGSTPFVLAALEEARHRGAATALVTCVPPEDASPDVDIPIRMLTGPEALAGSTRLKAGTATKMALNAITTLAMVRIGKVFGNRMVDLERDACEKLRDRAVRIVSELTGVTRAVARERLEAAGGVKTAILVELAGVSPAEARERLRASRGRLREALDALGATGRPRAGI